jgi:hypothetical protein
MNKDISIFKKIKIFNTFKKTLKLNRNELEKRFNIRIDNAKRMYTVLNIPEELIGEPYNIRKSDIDKIAEKFIREYSMQVARFLDSKGLQEMYDFYKVDKVGKYSYLIVIGFSLFRSHEYYNNIYYKIIPSVIILSTILALIFLI